jgi:N-acyl-D-amino-acid deacylase
MPGPQSVRWLRAGVCAAMPLLLLAGLVRAQEPPEPEFSARLVSAVERGLPLVEAASLRYGEHRKCFSCHHQTLPMLAVVAARGAGIEADESLLKSQADFTRISFGYELDDLQAGKNIGGKALTVSYGLWTLGLAGEKPDDVSRAMVTYLLKTQEADGHWGVHTSRPPMEDSLQTTTVLSIIGLQKYATGDQKTEADAAIENAKQFFKQCTPASQEDRISRLWALHLLEFPAEAIIEARDAVLTAQRDDGGWAQLDTMQSDAYATGMTLCVLLMTGGQPTDVACRRGLEYLLETQLDDGSWHVSTRSKPVQVYFDNGDPHGKDQFISTPASCWALVALAMSARGEPAGARGED